MLPPVVPSSVSSTSCNAVSLTARRPQAPSARPAVTPSVLLPVVPKLLQLDHSCDAVRPTALRRPPAPSALPACDAVRPTARRSPAQPAVTPSVLLPVVPQLCQLYQLVTPSDRPTACRPPASSALPACNVVRLTACRPPAPSVLLSSSPSSVSSTTPRHQQSHF
ncbi:classical arabinogalactan protein 9-like [Strongylocentrotus purpuratus]|uniref:Uncharacterized protein n=1 Tax=Strongylocentrotus purpuratus TaxID=7668 RepID=A0A7M7LTV6_STRPU|nr:classical arabinogalactan protein 9-like [Strongylocentrotus purpuratus]|eukprot:XP_011680724.1 PREDICTED: classical arabinogalactan protein 9-like [Strongylocentrotus purpuratus]